jgi:hypothetical protein
VCRIVVVIAVVVLAVIIIVVISALRRTCFARVMRQPRGRRLTARLVAQRSVCHADV